MTRTYNFDEIVNRRGTCSYKWDAALPGELPMWVADMDFRAAPAIMDALQRRLDTGVFGYTLVPDSYYQAVINWWATRHGWTIQRDWMLYTSGVLPAIAASLKAITRPGDKVILQTPVYNCFFASVRNAGCILADNRLIRDGRTYRMDFDDLELKASDPQVKAMILCNPHNPVGRVWTPQELLRVAEICSRHGVTVISDEIHCDLVFPGFKYTPFASVSDEALACSITCMSPSKAFNIAGLQIANIVTSSPELVKKIDRAINDLEVCDVNPFGVVALQAAYNQSADWLDQLIAYLKGNYDFMLDFCRDNLPGFPVAELEGTYLVWMDCSCLGISSDKLEEELRRDTGLWLNSGSIYGMDGDGYLRWNIACPRSVLADGLGRFARFVKMSRTAKLP